MGRNRRRLWFGAAVLGLIFFTSGCSVSSLSNLLLGPPSSPAAASHRTAGAASAGATVLEGLTIYHYFAAQDSKVAFTVSPAPDSATVYLDGMGQAGALDESATDPTLKSLNIVCNNFDSHDVVYASLYTAQGALAGTVPVKASGAVDVASYKATSCRLAASSTDKTNPSPVPYAYLYQMTNSAGTTFTYTVPPPPS